MGFLNFVLSGGGTTVLLINVGLAALPFLLPNGVVEKMFFGIGKTLSFFLRQKVGKTPGEKVEGWIQGTAAAAMAGLNAGLDSDDGE